MSYLIKFIKIESKMVVVRGGVVEDGESMVCTVSVLQEEEFWKLSAQECEYIQRY